MYFYVKSQENKYGIDTVFSYSQDIFDGYDYRFETEPKLGQYIVDNKLVAEEKYDEIVAPIIASKVSTELGVVPETILAESPTLETPPENVPDIEYWKLDISEEALDEYKERVQSLNRLITFASNPANINAENKLVMSIFSRSGEARDTPVLIDILDPTNNINTTADYINTLIQNRDMFSNTIIPWLTQELNKKK